MSGMVGLWGASGLIRSVQYGNVSIATASLTGTSTITAVDMANAMLLHGGSLSNNAAANPRASSCRLTFTNATTITATRGATGVADSNAFYVVVEFVPGIIKSIQRGTITLTSVSTANATITEVNKAKSAPIWLGSDLGAGDDNMYASLNLTNGTTVRADRYASTASTTVVGYQVVEWF